MTADRFDHDPNAATETITCDLLVAGSGAAGFSAAMEGAGSESRALVMRTGADSEMTSGIGGASATIIKEAPGLRREGQTALASAELFVIIDLPKISTNTPANVPMRGIDSTAMKVREEARIIQGRMLEFGCHHTGGVCEVETAVIGLRQP